MSNLVDSILRRNRPMETFLVTLLALVDAFLFEDLAWLLVSMNIIIFLIELAFVDHSRQSLLLNYHITSLATSFISQLRRLESLFFYRFCQPEFFEKGGRPDAQVL